MTPNEKRAETYRQKREHQAKRKADAEAIRAALMAVIADDNISSSERLAAIQRLDECNHQYY